MDAHRGRRAHSESLYFTRARLGVVGFLPVCVVLLGRAYGSSGSFGLAWGHSVAPR